MVIAVVVLLVVMQHYFLWHTLHTVHTIILQFCLKVVEQNIIHLVY